MPNYALVDDTGAITAMHQTPVRYIEAEADVSDDTHYFDMDTETIEPKETPDVQTTIDGLVVTLKSVPIGASIAVAGVTETATAETVTIELEAPGQYQIRIYGVPQYREQLLTVEV